MTLEPLDQRSYLTSFTDFSVSTSDFPESTTSGQAVYFAGPPALGTGLTLWRSDGSPAGTRRVVTDASGPTVYSPLNLTDVNGTLYFSGRDTQGMGIFKTDGTSAGTKLVRRLDNGWTLNEMCNVNGTLFLSIYEPTYGSELWKTDGTAAGTTLVKDISPGADGSAPGGFYAWNGRLYFWAATDATGLELYTSDGTAGGTYMVREINPGAANSLPSNYLPYNGKLYFTALNSSVGTELWVTDGTYAGTKLVKDLVPGSASSYAHAGIVSNGSLFIVNRDNSTTQKLWKLDNSGNVTMVKDFGQTNGSARNFAAISSTKFVFAARTTSAGTEPWVSDGTSAGTFQLKDVNGGSANGMDSTVPPVAMSGKAYFRGVNGTNSAELWETDGTTSGTKLSVDIAAGATSSSPRQLVPFNGKLLVKAISPTDGKLHMFAVTPDTAPPPPPPPPTSTTGSIRGYSFNDNNVNGVLDSGDSKAGGKTIFLDANNNGKFDSGEKGTTSASDGSYAFTGLVAGTYYVRRIFPSGYTYSNTPLNILLASGQNVTDANIGSRSGSSTPPPPPPTGTSGSIRGYTFNDNNVNGVLDSGDSKISGKTVFLDSNNNGKLDSGEKSTKSATDGSYEFSGLAAGTYYVRRVFPSGYTYSNTPLNITLTSGQSVVDANIGSRSTSSTPTLTPPPPTSGTTGSISGVSFNDNNVNGLLDSGDTPTGGKTVFLDTNNNGKLDSGEKSTKSASNGSFTFTGLAAGPYYVRRVFPSGYTYSNAPIDITLSAGQVFTGANIGSRSTSSTSSTPPASTAGASISGFLFWDADEDALFDSDEPLQSGKTVFLDQDGDNRLDSNERRTTTDARGRFSFDGLPAGSYRVLRVLPKGYVTTTPVYALVLQSGDRTTGIAIGTSSA